MKKMMFIVFLLSLLLFNPYTMNRYIRPMFSEEKLQEQPFMEQKIAYMPDRYIGAMGDSVIMYDGRHLSRIDENGKEIFSAAIRSDNFAVDTLGKQIYVLDKVRKKVYSIKEDGQIAAQVEIQETPLTIKALSEGRFALHYVTDVQVEGLFLYDKNCKLLKDITYPKRSINFVAEDEERDGMLVSSLIRDPSMLKNNIYLYDSKLEPIIATDVENTVFMKASLSKEYMALMDSSYVAVYDRAFRPKCRISAENSLKDIFLTEEFLYTVDTAKKFRKYDLEGKLVQEELFKEDILAMRFLEGEPLIVSRRGYRFRGVHYDEIKDIADLIVLENKIAVFSKDSIRYVRIP